MRALSLARDLFSALCFKDYLLFKPVTALNERHNWVLPSGLAGEACEPSSSRWLDQKECSRRTPRKRGLPSFAAACVCIGAASGTECLLGHHLVGSLPGWVPPKVKQCLRKLRTQLQLCCFYAILVLDWLLFPWGGGDARTVSVPLFGQA